MSVRKSLNVRENVDPVQLEFLAMDTENNEKYNFFASQPGFFKIYKVVTRLHCVRDYKI